MYGYLCFVSIWICCAVQPKWAAGSMGLLEPLSPNRWQTAPNKYSMTVNDVFMAKECDQIISWTETQAPVDSQQATIPDVLAAKRKATLWRIDNSDASRTIFWVTKRMIALMQNGNELKWKFPMAGTVEPIYIVKYELGDRMDWHWDAHKNSNRLLSATVQLSKPDDYNGGYLVLGDHISSKDRGTFTLFPSYVMHAVGQLTEGSRYALVAYFKGKPGNAEHQHFPGFPLYDLQLYSKVLEKYAVETGYRSSSMDLLIGIGEFQKRFGDTESAKSSFQAALDIHPLNAVVHSHMGSIHHDEHDLRLAQRSLQIALSIDPQLGDAHNNLGLIYREEKDYEQAEKSFKAALKTNRQNALWHANLGMLYTAMDETEEGLNRAKVRFQVALRIDPALVDAHHYLGTIQFALWDMVEAKLSLERAVDLNPLNAETHHALGLVASHEHQTDEAMERFKNALRIDPAHVMAVFQIGNLHVSRGDVKKAATSYDHAVALYPLLSDAWFKLGMIDAQQGNLEKAKTNFRIARALDPSLPENPEPDQINDAWDKIMQGQHSEL